MTAAQTMLYFREWGAVRKHYTRQGIDPKMADSKRHELHRRALGYMKSSKDFTNAEFDKVLAVFRAITQPGNLVAQLRALDQPAMREGELFTAVRVLASRCVTKPGLEDLYLNGMARKIFGAAHGYHDLGELKLAQLKGILERRVAQLSRAAQARGKQAPGELAAAGKAEAEEDPF